MTDEGNEPHEDDHHYPEAKEAQQSRLHSLFVTVTGQEEFIDPQNGTEGSRYIDAETESISATVTAVGSNDNLADAIDESHPGTEQE